MRMPKLLAVFATLGLLGTGCDLGSVDGPPPPAPTPPDQGGGDTPLPPAGPNEQILFQQTVAPMLIAKCSGVACHNGEIANGVPLKFLGPNPDVPDYNILVAQENITGNFNPALAKLVVYHPDAARAFDAQQQMIVTTWLEREAVTRGIVTDNGGVDPGQPGTPIPPPTTERELLAMFSACMDLNQFNATGLANLRNKNTNNDGPCRQCHNAGAGGLYLSGDAADTFTNSRYEIYLKTLYTTSRDPLSGQMAIVPNDVKFDLKSDPPHPTYNWNATDQQRLADFGAQTMARVQLSLDAIAGNEVCNPTAGFPIQ
jgi:hypothetical protein